MSRLLEDITVLDIGRYVAGPYCATLLGYLGAEIIRVERPSGGEDRFIAPLFEQADGSPGEGGLFMQTACGKKSVTLDLSAPEGREILQKLAASADIVVANLLPAALTRLGLDWDRFSALNPAGILVTQTTFGTTGPDATKGGFDGIGQAVSGAMYLTGTPAHPVKAGAPYVDYATAVMSAFAALAALMDRQRTGKGQHVETSLMGTALAVMNSHLAEQGATQINRVGTGNRVQTSAPSDVFATGDGHILVHTVGDSLFARWAGMVGRPELADDPRFKGDQARGDMGDELCAIMAAWCADKSSEDALAALQKAGVPAGPVLTMQQALDNPQVEAMGFLKQVMFDGLPRPAPVADLPARFSAMESGLKTGDDGLPPTIGQHNQEILSKLGYSDDDIVALADKGIISHRE